ncbi:lysylphosphatidylglycerol synthase domain-containing protein [Microvirga rosea]|uniref:lysylphosphatidylglycerol synthase domain-containing protein n=1 Tax=Microvirga rosea TaxID=2715425 RepID=UPI001D0A3136|nr:lysylphosphatidylglycerol synthase domain-containing protein [Microvirga rosea]MCB8822278.1 lysylphosphatidylglycerol synthase domain-containing protein [Microvirga rosea]
MNDMRPIPAPPPEITSAEALHPKERRSRRFAWIGMVGSLLLFGASLVVLWHIVSGIDVNELRSAFTAASLRQIGLAILFTAVSYSLLTCYDAIALRQLKLHIPYRTTALASFTSYAVSFTLGFPLLTAGTVRYWIYSSKGISAGRVASLTVIAGVTFWLGMALVLASSMIRQADEVASLIYTNIWINQLVGLVAAALVVAYLVWVSIKRRAVKIQGWRLDLPGFRLTVAQMLIGAVDVCAGAAVLFVLLPGGHNISFETFVAIYIFAVMLGVASHAPGGLGVFEATILLALSSYPREPILGALLLYRLCYYLVPFVVALAFLGAYEIRNRIRSMRGKFKPEEDDEPILEK